jgi:hypothetical protein
MIRSRSIQTRHWTLEDELKGHLLMWQNDKQFNRLPKTIQDGINFLVDASEVEAQNAELKKQYSKNKNIGKSKESNKRKMYLAIYKQKYLELTDLNCEEVFNGTTNVILLTYINKLEKEGATISEYLNWVFDDFLSTDKGEKFLPPRINITMGDFMYKNFMFANKDRLKVRKQDIQESHLKVEVMKVGLDVFKETQDSELAKRLDSLSSGRSTSKKVFTFLLKIAEKLENQSILKQVKELEKEL